MIADLQSERMNEQRCSLLPGLKRTSLNNSAADQAEASVAASGVEKNTGEPDDAFLDMLVRCQGSRLEEQRSELPKTNLLDVENGEAANTRNNPAANSTSTLPEEDLFSFIMRFQSGRMDDQRATVMFKEY